MWRWQVRWWALALVEILVAVASLSCNHAATAPLFSPPDVRVPLAEAFSGPYRLTLNSRSRSQQLPAFFLNVLQPSELRGTMGQQQALFGAHWPVTSVINDTQLWEGELALPHSMDTLAIRSCLPALQTVDDFNQSFAGRIVLLPRGCPYLVTQAQAQSAGAVGALVINCSPELPTICRGGTVSMEAGLDGVAGDTVSSRALAQCRACGVLC
jgi:hypothetical protein